MNRFDIFDEATTKCNLCKHHMDEKNDPEFPRVAVFSSMIWDSLENFGLRGWQITCICYTQKYINDYYK